MPAGSDLGVWIKGENLYHDKYYITSGKSYIIHTFSPCNLCRDPVKMCE